MTKLSENGYGKTYTEQKEESKTIRMLRRNFFMRYHSRNGEKFAKLNSNHILTELQIKTSNTAVR